MNIRFPTLCLIVGLTLIACSKPSSDSQTSSQSKPKNTDVATAKSSDESAESLRQRGNVAFREGNYVQPASNNAMYWYVAAREAGADVESIELPLIDLAPLASAQIEAMLLRGELAMADAAIALYTKAIPDSIAPRNLRAQLVAQQNKIKQDKAELDSQSAKSILAANADAIEIGNAPVGATLATNKIELGDGKNKVAQNDVERVISENAKTLAQNQSVATPPSRAASATTLARGSIEVPTQTVISPVIKTNETKMSANQIENSAPILLSKVQPQYPENARRQKLEGWVELEFTVTANGGVDNIQVLNASPSQIFNASATRALSRWKFKPSNNVDGTKPTRTRTKINFKVS